MKEDNSKIIERLASKGVFPYQFAFTLLIPIRNLFLSPKQLIHRLDLKENSSVLEIGPGPGYFSTKIAKVLSKGRLVLADIQQEMLNYAKKRLDKKGFDNIEYYLCDGNKFEFGDESFDRVFMITVIGEVEKKIEYMKEIHRMLKDDGMLSISELAGDPDKMTIAELTKLANETGFKAATQFGNEKNYTINFIKA